MISLEQQVCSLELSKKLKELGVPQESLFKWSIEYRKKDGAESVQVMGGDYDVEVHHGISWRIYDFKRRETYSAFTVAELGEVLPESITQNGDTFFLRCDKASGWTAGYPGTSAVKWYEATTEADARATLLIHLIANKLIDPKTL